MTPVLSPPATTPLAWPGVAPRRDKKAVTLSGLCSWGKLCSTLLPERFSGTPERESPDKFPWAWRDRPVLSGILSGSRERRPRVWSVFPGTREGPPESSCVFIGSPQGHSASSKLLSGNPEKPSMNAISLQAMDSAQFGSVTRVLVFGSPRATLAC